MTLKVACVVLHERGLSPGQRFRLEQWIQLLPNGLLDVTFLPLFDAHAYEQMYRRGNLGAKVSATVKGLGRRLVHVLQSQKADVAFLFRETFPLGPPALDVLLESRVPVVYDFDDAIFLGDTSQANAIVSRFKMPQKVSRIISGASITTVGNEFLATYAKKFSDSVRVLPTTIDTAKYHPGLRRSSRDLVRVGWSGSRTTSAHLETIKPVLLQALSELPIELHVIGDPDFQLPVSERVRVYRWNADSEISDLSSFDIGLMPLPDDDWSRGKCGLKALQYMALEIPPIVSPVGVNTEIVSHTETGLVASTEEEWMEALGLLVESESLRRELGKNARETVKARYSGQQWSRVFLEILQEAADRGHSGGH